MKNLIEISKELLQSEQVKVVIGYAKGSANRVRPLFARDAAECEKLLFDARCVQNLAVYLYKREIAAMGKPAIVANIPTLRAILRLCAEKQLQEESLIAIACNNDNEAVVLKNMTEIEAFVQSQVIALSDKDRELLEKIKAMPQAERWAFWQKEFNKCIKCYACRQTCPLCYCTECTVEKNKPQWITVASTKLGNLEWHTMRTMHLAGRCISCGQCAEACPMNIPLHLLPMMLAEEIREIYGTMPGLHRDENCALSTYKPNDQENFIH